MYDLPLQCIKIGKMGDSDNTFRRVTPESGSRMA